MAHTSYFFTTTSIHPLQTHTHIHTATTLLSPPPPPPTHTCTHTHTYTHLPPKCTHTQTNTHTHTHTMTQMSLGVWFCVWLKSPDLLIKFRKYNLKKEVYIVRTKGTINHKTYFAISSTDRRDQNKNQGFCFNKKMPLSSVTICGTGCRK